jgi:hypothetical protein
MPGADGSGGEDEHEDDDEHGMTMRMIFNEKSFAKLPPAASHGSMA